MTPTSCKTCNTVFGRMSTDPRLCMCACVKQDDQARLAAAAPLTEFQVWNLRALPREDLQLLGQKLRHVPVQLRCKVLCASGTVLQKKTQKGKLTSFWG